MSEKVASIVARAGVNLVINDYPEIAAEVGAFSVIWDRRFLRRQDNDAMLPGIRIDFPPAGRHPS